MPSSDSGDRALNLAQPKHGNEHHGPMGGPNGSSRASRRDERASVGLEVLVMAPMLALLVLLVLWAGSSGRASLTASLATEEAAVAAAVVCSGENGIDTDCASAVAEQVISNRTESPTSCRDRIRPAQSLVGSAAQEIAVAFSSGCANDGGVSGGVSASSRPSTAVHVLRTESDSERAEALAVKRPSWVNVCREDWYKTDADVGRPVVALPGDATSGILLTPLPSAREIVPAPGIPTSPEPEAPTMVCLGIRIADEMQDLDNEVVLAVWTEDIRFDDIRSADGGATCYKWEETGIDFIHIPKEYPYFVRLRPGDKPDFVSVMSLQRHRLTWDSVRLPRCDWTVFQGGYDTEFPGVYEVHIEIVSGGSGSAWYVCSEAYCKVHDLSDPTYVPWYNYLKKSI